MDIDPKVLKELIDTFHSELEEMLQVITNGLLELEENKENYSISVINDIFRAAHTIKGASRSLGINDVGEIAHRMESLFSRIQKKEILITAGLIDLILNAVDKMREAFQAFVDKKPLSFNLSDFLNVLENFNSTVEKKMKIELKKTHLPDEMKQIAIKNDTIRVSVNKIEKISSFMEEIQVNKIAIDDQYNDLTTIKDKMNEFFLLWKQLYCSSKKEPQQQLNENDRSLNLSNNDLITDIRNLSNQLHQNMKNQACQFSIIVNSLQEEINQLRLVPFSNLLKNFQRYVRDIAHELNKKVELIITGETVKMDKLLLESLHDPILHILRNAIDHGIEDVDNRKSHNKSDIGHIKIDISEEGNQVIVLISDDGRGMNLNEIAETAVEKNIITKEKRIEMKPDEIINLIFFPQFSTKKIITELSGRGMGLDIVKTNLSAIKGKVMVTTQEGEGTSFCISVPRSVTAERGLMISSGSQFFIIPSHSIEKILTAKMQDIIDVNQNQIIYLEDRPIPLFSLSNLLNFPTNNQYSDNQEIVVIRKDSHVIGLVVDEVGGEREIIIKPIQQAIYNVRFVLGGTLFKNNQVILVLNPAELIKKALGSSEVNRIEMQSIQKEEKMAPHILLVDDSITTRTLEKNILESKNYRVTVAVNGKEAWDLLQNQHFSLLITDINMPIMDGFTLTQQVKQNEKTRDLPVIIVTSLGSEEEKKRGIHSGADAYIVKSEFESGILLDVVSQWV